MIVLKIKQHKVLLQTSNQNITSAGKNKNQIVQQDIKEKDLKGSHVLVVKLS